MLNKLVLNKELQLLLKKAKNVIIPTSKQEIVELIFKGSSSVVDVCYDVEGSSVREATVTRCKNGISVNYCEDYMRRRDPDCLIIADELPTDKPRFKEQYNVPFDGVRTQTLDWLFNQEIIIVPFMAGGKHYGYPSILIAPLNAAFFAAALADLQYFIDLSSVEGKFEVRSVIYLAPPFRHTIFSGKQIVVHNRTTQMHELFSYNLYPGPSAKKGVYGILLSIGEEEGWITNHASTVKVITPYENEMVIMHEGASGGGKSEMLEAVHTEVDGKIVIGQNLYTKEKFYLTLKELCQLRPVTDDMALSPIRANIDNPKLVVCDAEDGWFLRVDGITKYGSDPTIERLSIETKEPLVFLNIDGIADATCLVWEHTLDSNGKPCPNPRMVLPRKMMPDVIDGTVEVDVRTFGVRTPPCSSDNPSYGILGMLHIIPPALAWLWRLVAPRGYNNPSIIGGLGMESEGVGSYWPFATGKKVTQANLLLKQIINSPSTRFMLIPNQHIGYYKVGFMPGWLDREYLARRGSAKFKSEHLVEARCNLLGYCLESLKIDGQYIRKAFLQPETQAEIGLDGYDKGAKILSDFFKQQLPQYLSEELDPLGRKIINCCLNDGTLQDYLDLIPMRM